MTAPDDCPGPNTPPPQPARKPLATLPVQPPHHPPGRREPSVAIRLAVILVALVLALPVAVLVFFAIVLIPVGMLLEDLQCWAKRRADAKRGTRP